MNRPFFNKYFAAALLSAGCFFAVSCGNSDAEIKALTDKVVSVEVAEKIESFLSQDGKIQARLTAPLMKRYDVDSPYYEFPKTLHVDFYNDSAVHESKLDARYGKYNEGVQKVFLRDSVVVINMLKGDTLYCDELWWDQKAETFYTDKKVRIRTLTEIIDGMGMNAKQNFTEWNILNGGGTIKFRDSEL